MSDETFNFKRDYRRVLWGKTLGLNLLRAACGGIVIFIIIGIATRHWDHWPMMIALPAGYLVFILPGSLIASALARRGVAYAGFISLILSLYVIAGDPIVFVLHRLVPKMVPVEKFYPLNFAVMICVLRPEPEASSITDKLLSMPAGAGRD